MTLEQGGQFPVSIFQFLISSFCFVDRRSYLCCTRRRAGFLDILRANPQQWRILAWLSAFSYQQSARHGLIAEG